MVAKSSKKDASPTRRAPTKDASTSRTYRKSPARTEKPKSPARKGARSPPASPSRKSPSRKSPSRKSPSRKSPVRTKSPSRRSPPPRSPSRRSPGRPTKAEANKKMKMQVVDIDSDSDVDIKQRVTPEKPKAAVRGRARKLDSDYTSPKVILQDIHAMKEVPSVDRNISSYAGLVRRSMQKSQSREMDRIVHLRSNDSSVQRLTEFSDEDEVPAIRSSFVKEKSERYSEPKVIEERVKTEFGGWIGALVLMFIIPVIVISLVVFCNEVQCSFTKLPNLEKYKRFSTYIDTISLAAYSGFVLLIAILSALPFAGAKVSGMPNKQGKLNYVMNGLFVTVAIGLMVIALEFYNVPVISFVFKKYFQLVISSTILGCLFSIYLYVRSFFVPISALNPYAISNSKIYNFWAGRELNPRIFGVIDVKLLFYRIFATGMILINGLLVYKSIEYTSPADVKSSFDLRSLKFNPTLLTIATLQTIYCLDYLVFESSMVTTFEIQYEGVGNMFSMLFFPSPFLLTAISKYVYDHGVQLPAWQLGAAILIFLIGYVLLRASNSQKNAFRQNPYNPTLSHLESIPTSQGKKLLVSGYWGFVRHPNYLGEILVKLSFIIFIWNAPPLLICLGDIALLAHRSHRDGVRCKQRYGTAWDRYCQRVKYVLIPKVY